MNVDLRYMHCPIFGVCANFSVHCNGYSLDFTVSGVKEAGSSHPHLTSPGAGEVGTINDRLVGPLGDRLT